MGESDEKKKISENMMELVDLIANLDDVVKYLRERDVLTEEEEAEVTAQDSTFNKKSHLIWLIKEKEAFTQFTGALRATGNDIAADKLDSPPPPSPANHIEAEVTIESHPQPDQKPDQEGMALAVEIEQELERIQSGMEKEEQKIKDANSDEEIQEIGDKIVGGLEERRQDEENHEEEEQEQDHESDVRVEITAPTESEPEVEDEIINENGNEKNENGAEKPEVDEFLHENGDEKDDEIAHIMESSPEPPPPPAENSPKSHKQVTFGGEVNNDEPEEFVLHGNDDENSGNRKSIVAMNREKFEKPGASSPNGESAPKVKYSFGKKGGATAASPKEEEPKESTVKNLRNFFQKLGSIDQAEEGSVLKRGGVRQGGSQNRRTMI